MELPVRDLVERLATSEPVPGGGSASALVGAMGAALVHMVVDLTVGRPTADGHEEALAGIGHGAASRQSELLNLAELDATAYDAVVRARRLSRQTDRERESRTVQVTAALREATRVPLVTARAAAEVLGLAERLASIGNRNAISDVGVAALLAGAAVRGAALNVEINLPYLAHDEPVRAEAAAELADLVRIADERERAIRLSVAGRLA